VQDGAARIGSGRLDQQIDVHSGDELEALAIQFNTMAARLKDSYEGLERKVEERTRELSETLKQQTATGEILRVISGSLSDTQPVFQAIAKSCVSIFPGSRVTLSLAGDGVIEPKANVDAVDGEVSLLSPFPLDRNRAPGAWILDGRVIHIPDFEKVAEEFPYAKEFAVTRGLLSGLFVPLMREGKAIGVIMARRKFTGFFTDKEIALLRTFADQAVIAIENVRLFHEIQEKSRQLEIANRHKSEFLASMSHELRTPLNAIIGFSEVLHERMFGELNDKQAEYITDIHESGKHLLSLINDILDLSKVEAGRMELELSQFDLASTLANALTLVRERATRHGIALALECDSEIGDWVADERKFKQIMLNLLSNAVKFTPEGGSITVRAGRAAGAIEVAVSDTGVGIKPEDQELVFEEFRQAGSNGLTKSEGTGLGLALTKRFMELHGGSIRLQSEPGKGSTFAIILPERRLEDA
jgi:signal transduction histidine kinase